MQRGFYLFIDILFQGIAIILKDSVQVKHKVDVIPKVVLSLNMCPEPLEREADTEKVKEGLRQFICS